MASLVLASASPRRRQLLVDLGAEIEVVPADVAEVPLPGESGDVFALRLAREKVAEVAGRMPHRWILGADTVVIVDRDVLGKPTDVADARSMLRQLSGRVHRVSTAVVLRAPDGRSALEELATTEVEFRQLSDEDIEAYLRSGEPTDKAGAYAIQGGARHFVVRIEGSYSNVVGLPTEVVAPALRRAGLLPDGEVGSAYQEV